MLTAGCRIIVRRNRLHQLFKHLVSRQSASKLYVADKHFTHARPPRRFTHSDAVKLALPSHRLAEFDHGVADRSLVADDKPIHSAPKAYRALTNRRTMALLVNSRGGCGLRNHKVSCCAKALSFGAKASQSQCACLQAVFPQRDHGRSWLWLFKTCPHRQRWLPGFHGLRRTRRGSEPRAASCLKFDTFICAVAPLGC